MPSTPTDSPAESGASVPKAYQMRFDAEKLNPEFCKFVPISEQKDKECPICHEEFPESGMLMKEAQCGQTFCMDCFLMWFELQKTSNNCPMCRRAVRIVEDLPRGQLLDALASIILGRMTGEELQITDLDPRVQAWYLNQVSRLETAAEEYDDPELLLRFINAELSDRNRATEH